MDGHKFFQPHFKPDFNIDLLCTVNYICHLFCRKKRIVDQIGMLKKEFDGAQDYDLCSAVWKLGEESRSIISPESFIIGDAMRIPQQRIRKARCMPLMQEHVPSRLIMTGSEFTVEIEKGEYLGLYRTKFLWEEKPLISIIIPNKDHIDDLKRCIDSIEEKATYRNYEYVIVENNSTEDETFAYYKELEAANPKAHVVYWDGIFNYSAINNFGAAHAKGDYLLLLNNDTEIISPDCLEQLLGYCMRPDVGAVGRGSYEDDTVQHAGSSRWLRRYCGTLLCAAEERRHRILPQDHLCSGLQRCNRSLHDGEA